MPLPFPAFREAMVYLIDHGSIELGTRQSAALVAMDKALKQPEGASAVQWHAELKAAVATCCEQVELGIRHRAALATANAALERLAAAARELIGAICTSVTTYSERLEAAASAIIKLLPYDSSSSDGGTTRQVIETMLRKRGVTVTSQLIYEIMEKEAI